MNKFLDDCATILASQMNNFPEEFVNKYIREFTAEERFLAYLWMTNEVNELRVNDGWSTKLLVFPEEDRWVSLALIKLGVYKQVSEKKYSKLARRFDKELVDLVSLHMVSEGLTDFATLGIKHNRYASLYYAIEDKLLELNDRVSKEYFVDDEDDYKIKSSIAYAVVNDPSIKNANPLELLNATQNVYEYILKKFPHEALPLVVDMGFIKELPFNIILDAVYLLSLDLFIHDIDYRYIFSPVDSEFKKVHDFVEHCTIEFDDDHRILSKAIEAAQMVVKRRKSEIANEN